MLSEHIYAGLGLNFLSDRPDHAVYVTDATGRIVFWNRGASRLLGWDEKDVLSDGPEIRGDDSFLFPPDDRRRGACDRDRARATQQGLVIDSRWFLCRDNTYLFGNTVLIPLHDSKDTGRDAGTVRWYLRIISDKTSRYLDCKQLETALSRQSLVAETLQESQLPALNDDFDGMHFAAMYRPVRPEDRVGGDFYDALALEDGGIAFFVGDASGKGLPAAARATEVRYSLRSFLRDNPDPCDAVARVNRMLCRCANLENRTDDSFTTLSLAVVYPEKRTAYYIHAGGEYPLHFRANGKWVADTETEGEGIALGIREDQIYTATELSLRQGDILILFTDGITESRNGNDFFGIDRIAQSVQSVLWQKRSEPQVIPVIADEIMHRAIHYRNGAAGDDMCLIAVQIGD